MSHLHHSRHLKRRGDFFHFRVVEILGLFGGVPHGGEDGVADEFRVLLEKLGVEREREEFARAVDFDFHGAAAAGDVEFPGFELRLKRLDLRLHFLRLFEKFSKAWHGERVVVSWLGWLGCRTARFSHAAARRRNEIFILRPKNPCAK